MGLVFSRLKDELEVEASEKGLSMRKRENEVWKSFKRGFGCIRNVSRIFSTIGIMKGRAYGE